MGRVKKDPEGRKKDRWEDNEISPSKYRSPTRYVESQSDEYWDKDVPVWKESDSDLTEEQIDEYLQSTDHLPKDVALGILREFDYNIELALDKCGASDIIPQLSSLEKKVLIAAAPLPCPALGVKSKPAMFAEKQVNQMLPHVSPSVIRDFYTNVGRDGCVPARGWLPRIGYILEPTQAHMKEAGLISFHPPSPLYEREKRVLRSSAITPAIDAKIVPTKLSKRNNLAIAMVGYGQSKSGGESAQPSPVSSPTRPLAYPRMDTRAHSVDRIGLDRAPPTPTSQLFDNRQAAGSEPVKRGRGRPRKHPHPAQSRYADSLRSSPAPSDDGSVSGGRSRRRDPLEIDMNWRPNENGTRIRRPSVLMMDNPFEKKEKTTPTTPTAPNGNDEPSTSRLSAGSDRNGAVGYNTPGYTTPVRRNTRSSSVATFDEVISSPTSSRKTRDKLHIAMVGYGQSPISSPRDRDGFVIPSLPRSTRSRHVTPSPPASPEI